MNVIKSSENLSKSDIFRMIKNPDVRKIKEVGGETFSLKGYVHYTDINSKGDEVELLAISCEEGNFATNSKTFIDQFIEMVNYFNEEGVKHFTVVEQTSKNGRTFYQCAYVD